MGNSFSKPAGRRPILPYDYPAVYKNIPLENFVSGHGGQIPDSVLRDPDWTGNSFVEQSRRLQNIWPPGQEPGEGGGAGGGDGGGNESGGHGQGSGQGGSRHGRSEEGDEQQTLIGSDSGSSRSSRASRSTRGRQDATHGDRRGE
ncbi:hypothetical protein MMC21_002803 [Puttea exsequens]|nr:hypothetical protein [Puttea exsequens]